MLNVDAFPTYGLLAAEAFASSNGSWSNAYSHGAKDDSISPGAGRVAK